MKKLSYILKIYSRDLEEAHIQQARKHTMKLCILSGYLTFNIVTGVDSCKSEEEEPGRHFRDDRAGAIILTMGIILILDAFVTNVHQDDNKDDADEDDFDVDVC